MSAQELRKADLRPYWSAMLCDETRERIAEQMRCVLDGNYFSLVLCNSYDKNSHCFTAVEVCPSQRLTSAVTERGGTYSDIHWGTQRYAMGVHTEAKTQSEGRADKPHGYVHFAFEPDRVAIDHFAPAGYRLLWIFAVERHEDQP